MVALRFREVDDAKFIHRAESWWISETASRNDFRPFHWGMLVIFCAIFRARFRCPGFFAMRPAKPLFDYPKYWAECFGPAPFLPMSREEMDQLGWDSCDVIIVTGDAYVDHPSFGMAIIGRLLEAQGFRVGIISQPDWHSKDDFMKLGEPN